MSWVKLDDKFHRNQKVMAASDAAHRIYVDALSYAADVAVPTGHFSNDEAKIFVKSRGKSLKVIEELVALRLWERVHDGFLIHDFDQYVLSSSRDRTKAWRDRKRNEDVRHGDVTVTSRGDEDVTSHERHGDAASRARGPEPEPIPVPVPVSPNSPTGSNSTRVGLALTSLTDDEREYLLALEAFKGATLTGQELHDAQRWWAEYQRLTPSAVQTQLDDYSAWLKANGKPRPRSIGRGIHDQLQQLNDRLADAGAPPRGHQATGRSRQLQAIGSLALAQEDPDDDPF